MINNKIAQVSMEVIVLMAVFAGVFVWMDFKKTTESNQFRDQSKQTNVDYKSNGLVNLVFGGSKDCGSKQNPCIVTAPQPVLVNSNVVIPPVEPVIIEPVMPTIENTFGITKEYTASIGHLNWLERLGLCILIILVVAGVGGLLDAIGGDGALFCRRFIMPFLVAGGISTMVYAFHPVWYSWLVGLLVTPAIVTLSFAYKRYGEGNFSRAMWLFMNAVVMGLGIFLISTFFHAHLLTWYFYGWYAITTGVWGGLYSSWEQFLGDWVTGAWLCSLPFYIYLTLQFSL